MKRLVAMLVIGSMIFTLGGCQKKAQNENSASAEIIVGEVVEDAHKDMPAGPVELNVITSFSGNDGNADNYKVSVAQWENETGNVVNDASGTVDETFKARVISDFEVGAEPDVLFYFSGSDADPLVAAGKVVSIDEIRRVYPDYASNMKDGMIAASPVDGIKYAVPVNGYWESLYVNKKVLSKVGVEIPGADYTWNQFLEDCEKIKNAGYTPIACALANVPHYWFEFSIYNHLSPETHSILPNSVEDEQGQAWVNGISDIKDLYERGYFPEDTLSSPDDETFQMFCDGEAAFLIDGSWKAGSIADNTDNIEDFTVTYVPAKGERLATDIIGGLSSGYYISRKAWDDPDKRATAISFVQFMTTDEVVSKFAAVSATALKNGVTIDESELNSLQKDCLAMTAGATGITSAVQDLVPTECRVPIFDGMPNIVTGKVEITDAVQSLLDMVLEESAYHN